LKPIHDEPLPNFAYKSTCAATRWDKDEQKLKRHSAQVQEMQEELDFAWTPELAWQSYILSVISDEVTL